MSRFSKVLCLFLTVFLTSTTLADGTIDSALRQLDHYESYSLELAGRDKDGEFKAAYFYSPDLQVMRRQDKFGTSTYLYDKVKRPDKVMVTRAGVAYMYRLDNPLLPRYMPGSFLQHYLNESSSEKTRVTLTTEGLIEGLQVGDYHSEGDGFSISSLVFEPDLEGDPKFTRFARYLRD